MAAKAGGKKGKKKGTTMALTDFLSDETGTSQGPGTSYVLSNKTVDWAAEMEDVDINADPTYGIQAVDRTKLPTAPKAARGVEDLERVPKDPPFTAYIGNLPYEASEEKIREFFKQLNVVNIRLPEDNGRFRGFGYVQFDTRQDLIEAMGMSDEILGGRKVRVDLAGHGNSDKDGGQRGGMRGRDDGQPDRTEGDWRGTREPRQDSSYDDRGSRGGYDDRGSRGGFEDRGSRGGYDDRGQRGGFDDYGQGRGYEDRGSRGGYDDRGSRGYEDRGPRGGYDRGSRGGYEDRGSRGGYEDRGWGSSRSYDDRGNDRGGDRGYRTYEDRGDRRGGGGFGRDRYDDREGGRRDGYGSRRDDDRGFGRDSHGEDRYRSERQESREEPKERPRLQLQPRSKPAEPSSDEAAAKSSIFGSAKPVDTAQREREIEEKLRKQKLDAPSQRMSSLENRGYGESKGYEDPRESSGPWDRKHEENKENRMTSRSDRGPRRRSDSDKSQEGDSRRERHSSSSSNKSGKGKKGSRRDSDQSAEVFSGGEEQKEDKSQNAMTPPHKEEKLVPAPPPKENIWEKRKSSQHAVSPKAEEPKHVPVQSEAYEAGSQSGKSPTAQSQHQSSKQHNAPAHNQETQSSSERTLSSDGKKDFVPAEPPKENPWTRRKQEREQKTGGPPEHGGGDRGRGRGGRGGFGRGRGDSRPKDKKEKPLPQSIDEMPKYEETTAKDFSDGNKFAGLLGDDDDQEES